MKRVRRLVASTSGPSRLLPIGLVLVVLMLPVVGCDSRSGAPDAPMERMDKVHMRFWPPDHNLNVTGRITPNVDGTIESFELRMAGRTVRAYAFPPGWDTDDWPPEPHQEVHAGRPMELDANVWPLCDGQTHAPARLDITYETSDGQQAVQAFSLAMTGHSAQDTEQLVAEATRTLCAEPVKVLGPSAGVNEADQRVWRHYPIVNLGTATVTVTSQGWSSGNAQWLEASTQVPADGEQHFLTVRGRGGICDLHGPDEPQSLGLFEITTSAGATRPVPASGRGGYACSI